MIAQKIRKKNFSIAPNRAIKTKITKYYDFRGDEDETVNRLHDALDTADYGMAVGDSASSPNEPFIPINLQEDRNQHKNIRDGCPDVKEINDPKDMADYVMDIAYIFSSLCHFFISNH